MARELFVAKLERFFEDELGYLVAEYDLSDAEEDGNEASGCVLVVFTDADDPASAEVIGRDTLGEWWPGEIADFQALIDRICEDAADELVRARVSQTIAAFDARRRLP